MEPVLGKPPAFAVGIRYVPFLFLATDLPFQQGGVLASLQRGCIPVSACGGHHLCHLPCPLCPSLQALLYPAGHFLQELQQQHACQPLLQQALSHQEARGPWAPPAD